MRRGRQRPLERRGRAARAGEGGGQGGALGVDVGDGRADGGRGGAPGGRGVEQAPRGVGAGRVEEKGGQVAALQPAAGGGAAHVPKEVEGE